MPFEPLPSFVSWTLSPLSSPVIRSTLHIRSRRRCCLPASLDALSRSREPWLREGAVLHDSQANPLHSASPFPPSPQLRMLWALTEVCSGGWDRWWWWWVWWCDAWWEWEPAAVSCGCWLLLLLPLAALLPPLLEGGFMLETLWWWWFPWWCILWWWLLWWWLPQLLVPRPLLTRWYWVGDDEAEEGELEGWIEPPLDPTPLLPDFSFRTSSSRLSLLPWPALISIPCWVVMVYTREGCSVHSTHFCWSSSTEKLRSRDNRAGALLESVIEDGVGWSKPSGCVTRLVSCLSSQPLVSEQGWRWLLLLGPNVSLGDSGSGPTKVSHRRWARIWKTKMVIKTTKSAKEWEIYQGAKEQENRKSGKKMTSWHSG